MQALSEEAFRNLLKELENFAFAHVPDDVWEDPEGAMQQMDEGQPPWQTSVDNMRVAEIRERLVSVFGLPRDLTDDEILKLNEELKRKAIELGLQVD